MQHDTTSHNKMVKRYKLFFTTNIARCCIKSWDHLTGALLNQSSKLSLTRPMHLIQLRKALDFRDKFFNCCKRLMHFLKPGFPISCKDRKHVFANTFLVSFLRMPLSSHSCNDRRYSYFTRNICN